MIENCNDIDNYVFAKNIDVSKITPYTKKDVMRYEYMRNYRKKKKELTKTVQQ